MEPKWTTVESKKSTYKPPHMKQPSPNASPLSSQNGNFNQNRGSYSPNRGGCNPNRGGYNPNRGGYNPNRGRGGQNRGGQRIIADYSSPEEEQKFAELRLRAPHIMIPGVLKRIERDERIDKLAVKFLTEDWIEYQCEGWQYVRIIKPDDDIEIPTDDDFTMYETQELDNGWGDLILFKMNIQQ